MPQLTQLLCRQGFKCAYCAEFINYDQSIDHVLPVVAGGPNRIENIVLTCPECNSSKQHKPVEEWIAGRGFKTSTIVKERIEWLKTNLLSLPKPRQ